jgi:hypothetical protein
VTGADLVQLEALSQGEGEIRVTKRWLRAIVAQLKATEAADRTRDIFDRIVGSRVA